MKVLNFWKLAALFVFSCSCGEPEVIRSESKVNADRESISVSSLAVVETLRVTSDCDWSIAPEDRSWVSVSPTGGIKGETVVKVTVSKNSSWEPRQTRLVVRYAGGSLEIPLRQNYEVTPVNVRDNAFSDALVSGYDTDGDGILSTKEAASITEINVAGKGIGTITGLAGKFPLLKSLDCSDNDLTELDLTGLTGLTRLDCSGNNLTSLDISLLVNLEYFDATDNDSLDQIMVWTGFKPGAGFSKPDAARYVEPEIPTPAGYSLVWQEEFNATATGLPDTGKWWYETAEPGWVNNELQTYIAGRKGDIVTAQVSDGTLKIRAIKDGDRVYSARVNTHEGWTYGYFEARLKLPEGKGTWPAFWMMPTVWSGWPEGGEIDIMEHVGCVPTEVSSSIHCKAYYHAINTQKTAARKISTVMDEFHVYALEWTPEYIRTYVDGELLFHYNPDNYELGRTADTWPFNKPFQLKLNLAWGGDWGGMYGVDESCLPAVYEIDYVRVFQKP